MSTCTRCNGDGGWNEISEEPDYKTCPSCDGYGKVDTANSPDYDAMMPCPRCDGSGEIEKSQPKKVKTWVECDKCQGTGRD